MLLHLTNVSKTFPGVKALKAVSFTLEPGEVHALVGENGAGKSTLIKIVTGVLEPDPGAEMVIGGRSLERSSPELAEELGLAAIYQQPTLFSELSVAENLMMGTGGAVINWQRRREGARRCLAHIGAHIDPELPVTHLRMAEKQLLEIARALSKDAKILIMDEPTSSLPKRDADHLLGLIGELRGKGVGIVYISHRLEEVLHIADRLTVLRDGEHVGTYDARSLDRASIIRLMAGRPLEDMYRKRQLPIGEEVVAVEGLTHRGSNVREVSFSVRAGEIFGLAGLVGAGRTELARAIFGIAPADAGVIRLGGRPVAVRSPAEAIRLGIAYVPEDRHLHGVVEDMPVAENITLSVLRQLCRAGLIDRPREERFAADYARRLTVKTPSIHTPVRNLSGGNQQKVALARWMAARPRVLILDEPTQGIDVGAKAEIYAMMESMAESGVALIMISSELPEILGMSDRIGVMRQGRLVKVFDRSEATQAAILEHAMERSDVVEAPA